LSEVSLGDADLFSVYYEPSFLNGEGDKVLGKVFENRRGANSWCAKLNPKNV
jgi:hypothetical protein